MAIKVIISH